MNSCRPTVYVVFPHNHPEGGPDAFGWWREEAAVLGLDLHILFADSLDPAALPLPDVLIMRDYSHAVHSYYESRGVAMVNTLEAMELSHDKLATARRLTCRGVATPETLQADRPATYASLAQQLGDVFVVKPNDGSQGRDVFLVASASDFDKARQAIGDNALAQSYIKSSHGRDIRVWTVGGRAFDAVVRSNGASLVSNFSRGGSACLFDGDREAVFALAEAASQACGLGFAGVDILFGPDGTYTVCEVNANPGFRTLSMCGGGNIVRRLLEYAAGIAGTKNEQTMTQTDIKTAYKDALDDINSHFAAFHRSGGKAYNPGLDTIRALDGAFGSPSKAYTTVHVGGTNGKGSTASTIAAVMTAAGYRTGLYTSPHLTDFRERIRVDGEPVAREFVVDFMRRYHALGLEATPSFFELTTAMAFSYFAERKVDIAIIEVGLGGRLDSTNIITPALSVITNISPDHMAILGNTEEAIATEKAGIIKPEIPVVIGSADGGVRRVFEQAAAKAGSPIIFAQDNPLCTPQEAPGGGICYRGTPWGDISAALTGACQTENASTVFNALVILSEQFDITPSAVVRGFAGVCTLAGLRGRWMPVEAMGRRFLCDTGHNVGAWKYLGPALAAKAANRPLRMVLGFVADKDLDAILPFMPREAAYYFVAPEGERAREASSTAAAFAASGIAGEVCGSVAEGIEKAVGDSSADDLIFVGGSTFVVAEFLGRINA